MSVDKISYGSHGVGEMGHSSAGPVEGGWARPGGNARDNVPTGDGVANPVGTKNGPASTPQSAPASGSGDTGGFARDGGAQGI